jgi:hypothetical protein
MPETCLRFDFARLITSREPLVMDDVACPERTLVRQQLVATYSQRMGANSDGLGRALTRVAVEDFRALAVTHAA